MRVDGVTAPAWTREGEIINGASAHALRARGPGQSLAAVNGQPLDLDPDSPGDLGSGRRSAGIGLLAADRAAPGSTPRRSGAVFEPADVGVTIAAIRPQTAVFTSDKAQESC